MLPNHPPRGQNVRVSDRKRNSICTTIVINNLGVALSHYILLLTSCDLHKEILKC